jgi:hypothetical protein
VIEVKERSTADRKQIAAKGFGNLPTAEQGNAVKVADFAQSAAQGAALCFARTGTERAKQVLGTPTHYARTGIKNSDFR